MNKVEKQDKFYGKNFCGQRSKETFVTMTRPEATETESY